MLFRSLAMKSRKRLTPDVTYLSVTDAGHVLNVSLPDTKCQRPRQYIGNFQKTSIFNKPGAESAEKLLRIFIYIYYSFSVDRAYPGNFLPLVPLYV